ncbi:glucose-repressible alcohol dehydrogenase transcriptional effector [Amanita muscaria]
MYYPQQSPGIAHKLASHHDQNPWSRQHLSTGLVPPGSQSVVGPPPPSPGYALYTNGNVAALQHHPAHHPHPLTVHAPLQHHHHHQNSLSHYPSPPNGHSHQQQHLSTSSPSSVNNQIISPHWQQQLHKCEMVRSSRSPHHRARASAMASRVIAKSAIPITNPNLIKPPIDTTKDSSSSSASTPDTQNTSPGSDNAVNHPSSTVGPVSEAPRPTAMKRPESSWCSLDMGGVNIKNLPSNSGLFSFTFLTNLYLNHNSLTSVPPEISKLRHLEVLDLSGNNLTSLPPELGMLTQLKELYIFDNHLTTLPMELGSLHQLQTMGIEGNPLDGQLKALVQKEGTAALVSFLRDSCPVPAPPPERVWKQLLTAADREILANDRNAEVFSVLCYNILCERYATEKMYGYTPSWALSWDYRKNLILNEIMSYDADFLCLQEVDIGQYEEYFVKHLSAQGYEGVFWPKSRYKTMNEVDRRLVDGCATFYNAAKYQLVEKHLIEFSAIAMQRQDFKKTDDMFNRVLGKDHIAVVCLFEDRTSGTRLIIANAHIHWDPAYRDVKLVQVALLVDEIEKIASNFARLPPRLNLSPKASSLSSSSSISDEEGQTFVPSTPLSTMGDAFDASTVLSSPTSPGVTTNGTSKRRQTGPTYSDGTKIPLIICGDFNSVPATGVYEFLANGSLAANHADFMSHMYGRYTSEGLRHRLNLKSAYAAPGAGGENLLTNYTPGYQGMVDYVWYSAGTLGVNAVLGEVDKGYLEKVAGFPNAHFPSDHVCIMSEFRVKPQRPEPRPPPLQPFVPALSSPS